MSKFPTSVGLYKEEYGKFSQQRKFPSEQIWLN